MQNPVTGSGGMLIGVVDAVGPESPLGLSVGDRVATLVSLTLTPLRITDGLARWDGRSRAGAGRGDGGAVRPLDRRRAARRPARRGVPRRARRLRGARPRPRGWSSAPARGRSPCWAPPGKSGLPEPRRRPRAPGRPGSPAWCATDAEAAALTAAGLADRVVVADATDPLAVAAAVGEPADLTVVCVDVPGAEHGAVLATADGGTVVFFSMATSFPAAALGAEGMAADVTMLVGQRLHAGARRPGPGALPVGAGRAGP